MHNVLAVLSKHYSGNSVVYFLGFPFEVFRRFLLWSYRSGVGAMLLGFDVACLCVRRFRAFSRTTESEKRVEVVLGTCAFFNLPDSP